MATTKTRWRASQPRNTSSCWKLKWSASTYVITNWGIVYQENSCNHKLLHFLLIQIGASLFETNNASHKFWDQSPFPHYQCCLQVCETVFWHKLRICYSSNMLQNWVGGRGLIYFCKVDHSRISRNFSRNWVGLNNVCEMLSENLRKLGK